MTYSPKSGDIIAFSGWNWQSDLINICSYGIPRNHISHVGIMSAAEQRTPLLYESTTNLDLPCAILGTSIAGAKAVWLDDRIRSYGGYIWAYPLVQELWYDQRERLDRFLRRFLGTPYDMAGAFNAGLSVWSLLNSFYREKNLAALFCSEWVAAAYTHLGLIDTHPGKWSPNSLVRGFRRRGLLGKPIRLK